VTNSKTGKSDRMRAKKAALSSTGPRASDVDRVGWRRGPEALDVSSKLGRRVRDRRDTLGMTLQAASEATGIPTATLSRIENNRMSPTISLVMKMVKGLNVSLAELLGEGGLDPLPQQLSVALPDQTLKTHVVRDEYEARHSESDLSRAVTPIIFEVSARRLDQIGGLAGHPGTEFSYILSGTLVMHFDGHPAQELPAGASILFNSAIPHAYLAKGRTPARVLTVLVRDPMIHDVKDMPIARRTLKVTDA
jgi:transcriptional regulator with XRE-family HTH domain